jgi:hypothetical protein
VKEHLERHHKIWKCLLKVFPHSRSFRDAVKSPRNIQMVTHSQHQILNKDTPDLLYTLKQAFKDGYTERVIPKDGIIYKRKT